MGLYSLKEGSSSSGYGFLEAEADFEVRRGEELDVVMLRDIGLVALGVYLELAELVGRGGHLDAESEAWYREELYATHERALESPDASRAGRWGQYGYIVVVGIGTCGDDLAELPANGDAGIERYLVRLRAEVPVGAYGGRHVSLEAALYGAGGRYGHVRDSIITLDVVFLRCRCYVGGEHEVDIEIRGDEIASLDTDHVEKAVASEVAEVQV